MSGEKFIPEWHLKQPIFTHSACRPFIKHRERILKLRKTVNSKDLYRNELGKACFAYGVAYSGIKYLAKKADKYDRYQRASASVVQKVYHNGSIPSGIAFTTKKCPQICAALETF